MTKLRIVVAGAAGRMGRTLIRAISDSEDCVITGALVRSGSLQIGKSAGLVPDHNPAVPVTDDAMAVLGQADAVVDFSTPQSTVVLAEHTANLHLPHVIGTTGLSIEQEAQIAAAAERTAIVKSENMSLGIALLSNLVRQAAAALPDFDIEILEMHHRNKADAPSGTALLLGQAAAEGRHTPLDDVAEVRNKPQSRRKEGAIGFASVRGGTIVGEHRVLFAGPRERITLAHTAEDRVIFALGALAAARWSHNKPAGLYSMQDVLSLDA